MWLILQCLIIEAWFLESALVFVLVCVCVSDVRYKRYEYVL